VEIEFSIVALSPYSFQSELFAYLHCSFCRFLYNLVYIFVGSHLQCDCDPFSCSVETNPFMLSYLMFFSLWPFGVCMDDPQKLKFMVSVVIKRKTCLENKRFYNFSFR